MPTIVNQNYGTGADRPLCAVPVDGHRVTITIFDSNNKNIFSTTADSRGNWRKSASLADGNYRVRFQGLFRPVGSGFSGQYAEPKSLLDVNITVPLIPLPPTPPTPGGAGKTGPQGPQGPQGAGVAGPQGQPGTKGATGAAGSAGAMGPMGPVGPAGSAGAPGSQGPIGPAGSPGSAGPQGPQGPAGGGVSGDACDIDLGIPDDGYWDDGLLPWTDSTKVCNALDDVNEILKALAPPGAPALSAIGMSQVGATGAITWGASHSITNYNGVSGVGGSSTLDVNGVFGASGYRSGIFDNTVSMTGTLGPHSAHSYAYPANSFDVGDGSSQGTIKLYRNGELLHSVDLTSFGSGNSLNVNGSGFTNITGATSVVFQDGTPLELFKYRTGQWKIVPADQILGWNYIQIVHSVVSGDRSTNYYEWVNDGATDTTTYSGEVLGTLNMSGLDYLSGVKYYTAGTVNGYQLTINNHHRNTYVIGPTAISHPSLTRCSFTPSTTGISGATSPNWEAGSQTISATINIVPTSNRILAQDIAYNTRVRRTLTSQSSPDSSTTYPGYSILLDSAIALAANQTDSADHFDAEGYRLRSNLHLDYTGYGSGSKNGPTGATWNSMVNISAASGYSGYDDGLLQYNSSIRYPTQGASGGNFATIGNGPVGNVNYSGETNTRVYLRYFYDSTTRQNFTFNFGVTNTNFSSVSNGATGSTLTCELLAPNTTVDGGGSVEWKDMTVPYTIDTAIGAYAATYGNTIPTNWGATIGTKSTATSGHAIVIRLTAAPGWTGRVDSVSVTFR